MRKKPSAMTASTELVRWLMPLVLTNCASTPSSAGARNDGIRDAGPSDDFPDGAPPGNAPDGAPSRDVPDTGMSDAEDEPSNPDFVWLTQVGTEETDHGDALAIASDGALVLTGLSFGASPDFEQAGGGDILLAKLDAADGSVTWQVQVGSPELDQPLAVAFDSNGDVIVVGYTNGVLDASEGAGTDGFAAKFDGDDGTLLWLSQFGTDAYDEIDSLAIDSNGDVFVVGYTEGVLGDTALGYGDVALGKLDGVDGHALWWTQFGGPGVDTPHDVEVDAAGDVLVAGVTEGEFEGHAPLGGSDGFVSKHDGTDGRALWVQLVGSTADDAVRALTVDEDGDFYAVGETEGDLDGPNAGMLDAFVSKRAGEDGEEVWTTQLGTPTWDLALSTFWAATDTLLVAADSYGPLGPQHIKARDIVALWMDPTNGTVTGSEQFGTLSHDFSGGIAGDADGNAYVAGTVGSELVAGAGLGSFDGFVVKLAEPSGM